MDGIISDSLAILSQFLPSAIGLDGLEGKSKHWFTDLNLAASPIIYSPNILQESTGRYAYEKAIFISPEVKIRYAPDHPASKMGDLAYHELATSLNYYEAVVQPHYYNDDLRNQYIDTLVKYYPNSYNDTLKKYSPNLNSVLLKSTSYRMAYTYYDLQKTLVLGTQIYSTNMQGLNNYALWSASYKSAWPWFDLKWSSALTTGIQDKMPWQFGLNLIRGGFWKTLWEVGADYQGQENSFSQWARMSYAGPLWSTSVYGILGPRAYVAEEDASHINTILIPHQYTISMSLGLRPWQSEHVQMVLSARQETYKGEAPLIAQDINHYSTQTQNFLQRNLITGEIKCSW